MLAGGVLIILAGVLMILLNRSADVIDPAIPSSVEQVPRVTVEEARAALSTGTAIFIDVRDPYSFNASHIPGAVNIPISALADHLDEFDPQQWLITYCT